MPNNFESFQPSEDGPARFAAAVTPNDSVDLQTTARGFMVGAAGNVKITTVGGSTVTLTGVAAGVPLPISVSRIWSTGTTATGIVALW